MLPIIIAKNQTIGDIYLENVGLTIPGSGDITLTDFAHFYEIAADAVLNQAVVDGDVIINDGISDLSLDESLAYLDCTGNLNGPVGTFSIDSVLKVKDATGRYVSATGVTIDSSDNLDVPGDITAQNLYVTADGIKILDHDDTNWLTFATSSNLTADRTLDILTGDADRTLDLSGAQGSLYYVDGSGNTVPLSPGISGQFLKTQGAAANPIWDTPGGSGDVLGPASSTDNAITRFDGTTGKTIQNSVITLSDTGTFDRNAGSIVFSTTSSGDISVSPADALNLSGTTGDWQTTGAITIDSTGGAISIGSDANAQPINIGTGAAARTITIGNTTGASNVVINTGTVSGVFDVNSYATEIGASDYIELAISGTGYISLDAATVTSYSSGTFNVDADGGITINSTGGAISIGADADAQAINIGTGAAARTMTFGNSTGATAISLNVGTGGLNLGTNATAHDTTIGSATSNSGITLQTGTGAYRVNAGGLYDINANAITIDGTGISIDGTSASNLSTTGANLTLSTITSGTLAVTSAGALNLSSTTGDWQASGALTIDSSGGAIGIGTDADAQAIDIGTGAAARTITMGNVTGATALVLNSGTGASAWNVTGAGTLSIGGSGHSGTITIGGTGSSQTIDIMNGISSGGTINIGNTNSGISHTINIGTVGTGGSSIVNIGSAISSSQTTISSGSVDLNLIGGSDITLRRSSSSGGTLTLGGINSTTSFTTIDIGTQDIATTITTGNSTGTTSISLDVGTGGLNLGTNATAHTTTVGSTTSTSAITLQTGTGAYTVNAGGIYDINATGAVTIDGPGISIDGTSASNLSVTGADLTVSTITSGTLAVTSAGALNLSASSGIGISSNTSITSSYVDIASISAPSNPSAGTRRLYVDSGTGKLSVRTSAGSTVSLEETGGSGGGTIPLSITIDADDTTISTGFKAFYPPSSISGTISSWSIMLDSVGSIEFDIWNSNGAAPTSADTITASAPPSVTSAQFDSSSTLTGWSTTITANDILGFEVTSISSGISRATLTLFITLL